MKPFEIPKEAQVVFAGIMPGDEDYADAKYGGFNVTKARRLLQRYGAEPQLITLTREYIAEMRAAIDINPEHVEHIMSNHLLLYRPLVACEVEPGVHIIIDGHHRICAMDHLTEGVAPIQFRCFRVPLDLREHIRVVMEIKHADGRRERVPEGAIVEHAWGTYTQPKEKNDA
jgi:hypothetical protein